MYTYDVGRWRRIDKQIARINRFQNDVECAAFSRKLVAKILLNGYLTIWHPRPAKYAPFCIMYNKSTYQSIAFVHFHVYRINVLQYTIIKSMNIKFHISWHHVTWCRVKFLMQGQNCTNCTHCVVKTLFLHHFSV